MAYSVRRGSNAVLVALVLAHNNTRRAAGIDGSFFHADITSDTTGDDRTLAVASGTVASANATDLGTSLTLANETRQRWLQHYSDDLAHKVADTVDTVSSPVATDLASGITLANEIKADFNTHIASTTYHYTADSTNTIATTNASDQTTLNALLNAIKSALNAHLISAPVGQSVKLIAP